jgi:hypothetical protein
MSRQSDKYLKPFNQVIQQCPICMKIDVYKGDGHSCGQEAILQEQRENDWK